MIDPITEALIRKLAQKGVGQRETAKKLKIARNTIRKVLESDTTRPAPERESVHMNHLPLIRSLFQQCRGNVVRVQEELLARHDIAIPYQSLTWLVRKHQIRIPSKKRAGQYHFEPGEELQHDTSPHRLKLGDKRVTAQCASLTLAYSRKLFIAYYPRFTRFECKIFLARALDYMQGSCPRCVIDNTSVIVSYGTGPDAVMAPEMEMFGRFYGMGFMAHRIGHADRKARVERPFDYVERNFLAGRTFTDWHNLNRQAKDWCDQVANHKVKKSLGMSPDEAWVMEKASLSPLPRVTPPVYEAYQRTVDVEGYVHLDTNRYSVPDTLIGKDVEMLKHWDFVTVYHGRDLVAKHDRLLTGRDKRITAPGHHRPLNRKKAHQGASIEEKTLIGYNATLDRYVTELKKRSRGRGVVNMRRLLELKRNYPSGPFMAAVEKAFVYGLYDLTRLEKMILNNTSGDFFDLK